MNAFNYAKYSFDDILTQLNGWMQRTASWDVFKSGTGQMLVELYAYIGSLIGYYTERRAQECYLLTARNRSSLLNLAALVGYQAKLRISASADASDAAVRVSIPAALGENVLIPRGTRLQTTDGINFYVTEDTLLVAGDISVYVSVVQGTRSVPPAFSASGLANYQITVTDSNLEASPPVVTVYANSEDETGVEWTWVSSFKDQGPASTVFKTRVNSDDSLSIIFGDGVRGAIPSAYPSRVVIEYTISDGVLGNVTTTGILTKLVDTLYTVGLAPQPVTATVTNVTDVVGGEEKETDEEIRDAAPAAFGTGDRAVTAADCRVIAGSVGSVVDSAFQGEYDRYPDTYNHTKMNMVYFSLVTAGDGNVPVAPEVSDTVVSQVKDKLREKGMMTVVYNYEQAEILRTVVQVRLRATSTTNLSGLYTKAVAAIGSEFVLGTTSMLGTPKYRSVIIRDLQDLSGVTWVHVDILTLLPLTDAASSPTTSTNFSLTGGPTTIVAGMVRVYLWSTISQSTVLAASDAAEPGTLAWVTEFNSFKGTITAGNGTSTQGSVAITGTIPTGPVDGLNNYILVQQNNVTAGFQGDLILKSSQIATLSEVDGIQFS